MPSRLHRFHESQQSHFITFSCRGRRPYFNSADKFSLFIHCLEEMRQRFDMCIYGYVIMPEHVHLLLSEPKQASLADALRFLKLTSAKRMLAKESTNTTGALWEKRYYDRNIRDAEEFTIKLRYLHRNPVKRGLTNCPENWNWSSFRHYAFQEVGVVEIESEWTSRLRERSQYPQVSAEHRSAGPGAPRI